MGPPVGMEVAAAIAREHEKQGGDLDSFIQLLDSTIDVQRSQIAKRVHERFNE